MVRAPRGPHPGERKRGWGGGKPAGGWGNGVSPSRRLRRNRFPDNGNVFWHFFQTMEACFGTFGPLRVAVAPLVAFPVEKFNLRERTAPFWLVLSLRFARQWKHGLRGREAAVAVATASPPLRPLPPKKMQIPLCFTVISHHFPGLFLRLSPVDCRPSSPPVRRKRRRPSPAKPCRPPSPAHPRRKIHPPAFFALFRGGKCPSFANP